MENEPFEDVFPIKNGDIPASYVIVYQRVKGTKRYQSTLHLVDGEENPQPIDFIDNAYGKSSPHFGALSDLPFPNAPCREYLPTFPLECSHFSPNVGKYSIQGASGIGCFGGRKGLWMSQKTRGNPS